METAAGGPSPEPVTQEADERLQVIHTTINASELSDHVKLMGKAWASDHVFGLTESDPAGGFTTIPNFIRKVEAAVSCTFNYIFADMLCMACRNS